MMLHTNPKNKSLLSRLKIAMCGFRCGHNNVVYGTYNYYGPDLLLDGMFLKCTNCGAVSDIDFRWIPLYDDIMCKFRYGELAERDMSYHEKQEWLTRVANTKK